MTEFSAASPALAADQPDLRKGLGTVTFWSLLISTFLGVLNDNIFRWVVIGLGKEFAGPEFEATVLSLGLALFVAPYLIFAAPAGYLADRFSKRNVIIGVKVAELLIMSLGVLAIYVQSVWLLFVVLFMMGTHSALFGPAKYGLLPEILRAENLAKANGILSLLTFVGIILGTVIGNALADAHKHDPSQGLGFSAGVLIGLAFFGCMASLGIRKIAAANPNREFTIAPFAELALLFRNRGLLMVALGIAYFWSLGALSNMIVDAYGTHLLELQQSQIGPLMAVLAIGIGVGSLAAGWLSGGRIELGLVPCGALGISICCIGLAFTGNSYALTCLALFAMGFSSGLFDVPLSTYIQYRSPPSERGSILAASNFLTFGGTLMMSGLHWGLRDPSALNLNPDTVFLMAGIVTLGVMIFIIYLVPYATSRFVIWALSQTIYRLRVYGGQNLPETGGALLVSNHISWADAVLLMLSSPRPIRMMAWAGNLNSWPVRWLSNAVQTIPLETGRGPKAILRALQAAKEAVQNGDLVCIFAEGQLSRLGQVLPFQRGFTRIVEGTNIPVIPVYLDELWGSIFSFSGGKFFWKWPKAWRYPVSIHFGKAVADPQNVYLVQRAVQDLGVEAVERRKERRLTLPRLFLRRSRAMMRMPKIADSMGTQMTGGETLLRSLILARLLLRNGITAADPMVGVLLPPSAGGVLANAALALLRKTSVNLNYSATAAVMNACIKQCNMQYIITSKKMMEKLDVKLDAKLIYLEDFKEQVTSWDKAAAAFQAYVCPIFLLERWLGLQWIKPDDPLTVVFTSGSTGDPKGVVLTHQNIGSNVDAMDQIVNLKYEDVLLGILPFFHSFGYTITLWTVLSLKPQGVYHFSPLDPRQIGNLCQKHKATILMATPTFMRSYLKRVDAEQFASLELILVGAEKLPPELTKAFQEKFNKTLFEGYGLTELSPLVGVNVPDHRSSIHQKGHKPGTIGRPIPHVAVKVVDPETGVELHAGESGMLLVRGPNLMQGYLNRPDLTAEKIKDGWYVTGDLALIDDEGFITITGRQSRFSKIGGEMVPHGRIEEELAKILGGEDELRAAVTAVPDEKKGERIIVIHTKLDKTPAELSKALAEKGLPNLWIPGQDSYLEVEAIPVLGSGKLALSEVKALALKHFAPELAAKS